MHERAKRFGLNATKIHNFTEEQLHKLHVSLGITPEDEKDIRFESLHMRGTDEMSTEDVIEYFGKYGPAGIEWINDESCNVIWNDKISAARALFFLSNPVEGMPIEGPCDPFIKELETDVNKEEVGRSILLKNKDREVELEKEGDEGKIHVSDITIPIPPGYWRLGIKHKKARFILLRFAVKSDKKPIRAEKFSEYYKKYGNPNFGGMRGIITESRRQKSKSIFDRNREIKQNTIPDNGKNPWGALAEQWEEDEHFSEQNEPEVTFKPTSKMNSNILKRLGSKRPSMHEDGNEIDINSEDKKVKIPRMRMYADEEEEKIKRKKQIIALKKKQENISSGSNIDLRVMLKFPKRNTASQEPCTEDLGNKLSNRNHKGDFNDRFESDNRHSKLRSDEYLKSSRDKLKMQSSKSKLHEHSSKYESRMHSDRYVEKGNFSYRDHERVDGGKPKSKVAIVIKAQNKPTVASTVWSRIKNENDHTRASSKETRKERRINSSTNSESSTESSSSSSSEDTSDSESHMPITPKQEEVTTIERPGFKRDLAEHIGISKSEHKSPLRIEINNDHYKK